MVRFFGIRKIVEAGLQVYRQSTSCGSVCVQATKDNRTVQPIIYDTVLMRKGRLRINFRRRLASGRFFGIGCLVTTSLLPVADWNGKLE